MISTDLFLASIIILLFLFISFLTIKYLFIPLFFKPDIDKNEVKIFLEKKNLVFIDARPLTTQERKENDFRSNDETFLERIYSIKSHYLITAFSAQKNQIKLYRLEIKNWMITYPKWAYEAIIGKKIKNKRELNFYQIKDSNKIREAEKIIQGRILIKDKCPACNNPISANDKICSECGLALSII